MQTSKTASKQASKPASKQAGIDSMTVFIQKRGGAGVPVTGLSLVILCLSGLIKTSELSL